MAVPSAAEIERRLVIYQRMSQVCLHAGKVPGGPWNIRVIGHCAVTCATIRVIAVGTDETWGSALLAVWDKMAAILEDPRLKLIP